MTEFLLEATGLKTMLWVAACFVLGYGASRLMERWGQA